MIRFSLTISDHARVIIVRTKTQAGKGQTTQMAEQQTETQVITCHWHPAVSTGLSCGQCRRPICTDCLVQVPVGIRCRECGRAQPLPTFDVGRVTYARALAAAAFITVAGIILWVILFRYILGPWTFVLMPPAVGYAAAELISRVVNLKRGRGLMYIAGGTVVVTVLAAILLLGVPMVSLWTLLAVVGGVIIAIGRVKL